MAEKVFVSTWTKKEVHLTSCFIGLDYVWERYYVGRHSITKAHTHVNTKSAICISNKYITIQRVALLYAVTVPSKSCPETPHLPPATYTLLFALLQIRVEIALFPFHSCIAMANKYVAVSGEWYRTPAC
jgi:hypothetical protein